MKQTAKPKFSITDHTASKVNALVCKMMADPRFKSPFGPDGKETEEFKKWWAEYERKEKGAAH